MFKIKAQGFPLLYLFFFLMLLLPTSYQVIRGVLLFIICIQSLSLKRTFVDKDILLYFMITGIMCFLNATYSIVVGNPGALANMTVFFIWPILYLWFCLKCRSVEVINNIFKIIIYGGIVVLLINTLLFINNVFLDIGELNLLAEVLGYRYGIYDGFVEFYSPSQSYIPYYLYFSVVLLLIPHKKLGIPRKYIWVMTVLSVLLILISGRRVMWLIVCVLPFFLCVLFEFMKIRNGVLLKVAAIFVILVAIIGVVIVQFLDIDYLIEEFMTSFDFQDNNSNYERTLQYRSITEDFIENPLFGRGNGYVSDYIRTPDAPWEYELTYNYLLSSFGLVGMLFLIIPYAIVLWKCTKLVRRNNPYSYLILPSISGSIVMLVANATNPYLFKFDLLWCFFLPILVLNQILKTQH